jgi:hypothetical protein
MREKEREGPRGKEGRAALGRAKEERAGRLLDFFPFPFFSSFLFFSKTIQTNYLNPNKFEFKPYNFNTKKNNAAA